MVFRLFLFVISTIVYINALQCTTLNCHIFSGTCGTRLSAAYSNLRATKLGVAFNVCSSKKAQLSRVPNCYFSCEAPAWPPPPPPPLWSAAGYPEVTSGSLQQPSFKNCTKSGHKCSSPKIVHKSDIALFEPVPVPTHCQQKQQQLKEKSDQFLYLQYNQILTYI